MRAGFTMLEMLIAIGIIIVLAGLTLTVVSSMSLKSEVRQAENTMRLLDTSFREWEVAADRTMRVVVPSDLVAQPRLQYDIELPMDWGTFPPEDLEDESVEALHAVLALLDRGDASRAILSNIDAAFLVANDDEDDDEEGHGLALKDPWESDYIVVFPGPMDSNAPPEDEDGTIRTDFELRFGICVNSRPLFVSAGPDGEFGDLSEMVEADEFKQTADNVYSGRLILPENSP